MEPWRPFARPSAMTIGDRQRLNSALRDLTPAARAYFDATLADVTIADGLRPGSYTRAVAILAHMGVMVSGPSAAFRTARLVASAL